MNPPPHAVSGRPGETLAPIAPVLVLGCSPRAGGNSALAGPAMARGVLAAGGESLTH